MPIVLEDEGHYVLTDLKDVRVTEEFLGLGRDITRCQNVEFRQRPPLHDTAQIRFDFEGFCFFMKNRRGVSIDKICSGEGTLN